MRVFEGFLWNMIGFKLNAKKLILVDFQLSNVKKQGKELSANFRDVVTKHFYFDKINFVVSYSKLVITPPLDLQRYCFCFF